MTVPGTPLYPLAAFLPPFTRYAHAKLEPEQVRRLFPQWAARHPTFTELGVNLSIKIEGPPEAEALR